MPDSYAMRRSVLLFNSDKLLEAHLSVEVAMQHASGTSCCAFARMYRGSPAGSWARRQYDRMSNFLNQRVRMLSSA